MWTIVSGLPMHSSTGRTRVNAASSPPTMIESVALIAPISPPLTGASSIDAALLGDQPRRGVGGDR